MDKNYDKQINKIWNENPKIPFMQSKEILRLGYIHGMNDKSTKPKDTKKESQEEIIENKPNVLSEDKTFTDNINFENATKKIKNKCRRRYNIDPDPRMVEGQLKVDVINYVLQIMDKKRDFIEVYTELQNYRDNIKNMYGL